MSHAVLTLGRPRLTGIAARRGWNGRPGLVALSPVAILAFAAVTARPAQAQFFGPMPVVDVNATGQWVTQLLRMSQQIAALNQQVNNQITALRKLSSPSWRDINPALGNLAGIMASAQSLGYEVARVDSLFRATYPVTLVINDWPAAQQQQARRAVETQRAVIAAMGQQARTIPVAMSRLATMKTQLAGIRGHQEAIELLTTSGVQLNEELVLLRQAVMTSANAQAVVAAQQANAEAQRDATVRVRFVEMARPLSPRPPMTMRVLP